MPRLSTTRKTVSRCFTEPQHQKQLGMRSVPVRVKVRVSVVFQNESLITCYELKVCVNIMVIHHTVGKIANGRKIIEKFLL